MSSLQSISTNSFFVLNILHLLVTVVSSSAELKTNNGRVPRAVHEIYLTDPLDCLSQLICGLNTFPPQVPSVRTTSANDFAYLLQHVIIRLKKETPKPLVLVTEVTTTTTTPKPEAEEDEQNDDDDDADSEEEDEVEVDEDTPEEKKRKNLLKNSKDQHGDIVEMKGLYPPLGLINRYRKGRARNAKASKNTKAGGKKSKKKDTKNSTPRPKPPSQLDQLQSEQDIRTKLGSGARCLFGILDHSCPFKYSELMILMSGILERQKVVSYSTNKILPLAGYLLKSRSLTQTLKATFMAVEKINNITISKNQNGEPFTFSHVYDEIVRGETGGNGILIVETKNEAAATSHVWEDDEFDAALKNPFLPKDKIPGYAIKDRTKNKKKQSGETQESVENSGDQDNPIGTVAEPIGPFELGDSVGFPSRPDYEDDENESVEESKEDVPLPPVFGFGSGQRQSKPKNTETAAQIRSKLDDYELCDDENC